MQLNIPLETPTTLKEEKSPNERLDFSFFLEPPELSVSAILTIDALAPLSMVTSQPGSYYRSQPSPTHNMLYGMLENALGWHFEELRDAKKTPISRAKLLAFLQKKIPKEYKKQSDEHPEWQDWLKGKPQGSGVGFISLLQYHLKFELSIPPPITVHYDDLWSQHLRRGDAFWDGSRNYDYRVEGIRHRSKIANAKIKIGNKGDENLSLSEITTIEDGEVHYKVLRPYYPQYYVSPTPREYVIPKGSYRYRVITTSKISQLVSEALNNPRAPLYLGSNDGWIDAKWEVL